MSQTAVWPLADQLREWAPEDTESVDVLDPAAANALHGLAGVRPLTAETLGPLDHWVYFHTWASPDTLASDGHEASGAHLPPLADRRRMFAGGRCRYHEPLSFGSPATARNSVAGWKIKQGRSGEFLLVTVQTKISQRGRLCLVEEQDLMYRSGPPRSSSARSEAEPAAKKGEGVTSSHSGDYRSFNEVALFQFSALTRNSHRIHYDAPYARGVEGYGGLLVQGTLLAYCLAAQLDDQQVASLASLSFSLRQPVLARERVLLIRSRDNDANGEPGRITWDMVGQAGDRRVSLTAQVRDPAAAVP